MLLSKSCEYGLRAMLYLTALDDDDFVPIGRISDALGISFHFLTKTFQKLSDAGLLVSQRGPSGGVRLRRPAERIYPRDVLVAIDGTDLFTECVLGLPECGNEKPCPLHDRWAMERARLESLFGSMSLAELSEGFRRGRFRLRALTTASDRNGTSDPLKA